MKEEQDYDKYTNQDCKERDRAILKQMIMPKRISPSKHVYRRGQLSGTHFVSDALHNDSARDHAGKITSFIFYREPNKVNTIITLRTKAALKYSGLHNCAYSVIDLTHLIITTVGGHRRPLGYFSKHNAKRGPRARDNFLDVWLLVFWREKVRNNARFSGLVIPPTEEQRSNSKIKTHVERRSNYHGCSGAARLCLKSIALNKTTATAPAGKITR